MSKALTREAPPFKTSFNQPDDRCGDGLASGNTLASKPSKRRRALQAQRGRIKFAVCREITSHANAAAAALNARAPPRSKALPRCE